MKFVKGDAVAGLVITFINIAGGLAVGSLQMGMSASEPCKPIRCSPMAMGGVPDSGPVCERSAGFVITRVASEDGRRALAQDMGIQVLRNPRVLLWAGFLLLVFAMLPGLPFAPFFFSASRSSGGMGTAKKQETTVPDPQSRAEAASSGGLFRTAAVAALGAD
jgi:type III secretory pathway component EscV